VGWLKDLKDKMNPGECRARDLVRSRREKDGQFREAINSHRETREVL
jgi:hypothetical protein